MPTDVPVNVYVAVFPVASSSTVLNAQPGADVDVIVPPP
jgi:hypothetical protein